MVITGGLAGRDTAIIKEPLERTQQATHVHPPSPLGRSLVQYRPGAVVVWVTFTECFLSNTAGNRCSVRHLETWCLPLVAWSMVFFNTRKCYYIGRHAPTGLFLVVCTCECARQAIITPTRTFRLNSLRVKRSIKALYRHLPT